MKYSIVQHNGIRFCLADIPIVQGDILRNTKNIITTMKAYERTADVIVFCETAVTGYSPGDDMLRPHFQKEAFLANKQIIAMTNDINITVIFGTITASGTTKFNRVYNAALVAENGKLIGATLKTLLPNYGQFDECRYFDSNPGTCAPITIKGQQIAILICEDLWDEECGYERSPIEELQHHAVDIIINPSGNPYWLGKRTETLKPIWESAEKRLGAPLLVVNQRSVLHSGSAIHLMPGADTDPENTGDSLQQAIVTMIRGFWERYSLKKAIVGVSGGIDSAVTLGLLVKALGPEACLGVHMPGAFTSDRATRDSIELCENLGVEYREVPIMGAVEGMLSTLDWIDVYPLAYENLQARTRGSGILSLVAAGLGGAHICTGNKTEFALGYSTLYGDATGAFAPLGDCYKSEVYAIARSLNKDGIMVPEGIINAAPSAELSPNQVDPFDYPYHDALVKSFTEELKMPFDIAQLFDDEMLDEAFGLSTGYTQKLFSSREAFIHDLDLQWQRMQSSVFKRLQAPPVFSVHKSTFGLGFREHIL